MEESGVKEKLSGAEHLLTQGADSRVKPMCGHGLTIEGGPEHGVSMQQVIPALSTSLAVSIFGPMVGTRRESVSNHTLERIALLSLFSTSFTFACTVRRVVARIIVST